MSDAAKKKDRYRETLNLPATEFAMKANLIEREPSFQKRWKETELEAQIDRTTKDSPPFVFHDGPPYANGPIHLGHLLNKVLKDMVVRSRRMLGYRVEFVPGWDCHGLPIEHRVMKELGKEARGLSTLEIRKRCQESAEHFIDVQAKQMQRLGTSAHYDDPYITMKPRYEAGVLEVFRELVREGVVYRALKPVHWSISNRTALAEAELEYKDRVDTSIFVLFELENPGALPASMNAPDADVSLMVWTTTPWTLPANLAVVVAPKGEYGLYAFEHGGQLRHAVVAVELEETVFGKAGITELKRLGVARGSELSDGGLSYRHPFIDRSGIISYADYVTTDDGTGLVHTAPGHGQEDYETGLRLGLDVYCPVRADGKYDETTPEWLHGVDIWKANDIIVERIRSSAHLFFAEKFDHSYPHDWRSKTPTIFRATEQWFIAVDRALRTHGKSLRALALDAADGGVGFVPEWGGNRLRGMVESRPDWCISRQRSWGLPIPAFICEGEETLLTDASVAHIIAQIREHGSNVWFEKSAQELLEGYDPGSDPDAPEWLGKTDALDRLEKAADIFDVWFESGSSWNAVLRQREIGYPAELYLEGSDQHRGWFQLSLLPALGVTGEPPFKVLLTHGFMVDKHGKKMSKSLNNAVEVDTILKQYGADIARWWVSSLNYANDIKVDPKFFKSAAEEYRKVRNTVRFLLGNLHDFDPKTDRIDWGTEDTYAIDTWARQQLSELIETCLDGYTSYQFKKVSEAIFNFCNETLSAVYLSAAKDRLYCNARDSRERRRTQTVLFDTAEALIALLAPILVHTAEEAWLSLHGSESADSIHLNRFPERLTLTPESGFATVMALRREVLRALEEAKSELGFKNPLDAGVRATVSASDFDVLTPYAAELADLVGVSRFSLDAGEPAVNIDDLREEPRCERSWKRDGTVRERSDGGVLTDRDAQVLELQ